MSENFMRGSKPISIDHTGATTLWIDSSKLVGANIKNYEEKLMKKTVTFKYMNGKPYTVRDVTQFDERKLEWWGNEFISNKDRLEFTQEPDKYTTINKTIPLNDVVGIIIKENGKTTIYENPAFNTVVDANVETVRSRIRKGNKKMKQREKASQERPQEERSWNDVKSFIE